MELAIEKPSEQEVVASHAVIDKPEPVKSVGELKSGISAKEIQGMIEDGRVSREDAIAYLQQRVDAKNAVGKTANKQTVNLLYKLKTQE